MLPMYLDWEKIKNDLIWCDTDKQIGDQALPCISPAGCGLLVEKLITLESHGIFYHFFCLLIKLAVQWNVKRRQGVAEKMLKTLELQRNLSIFCIE